MFNLTRKGLWAHKLRFVLTGLAVVLGVAFMAGTMILTDTMGKTFDGLFATANEGIDVVVRRDDRHRRRAAPTSGSGSTPASSTRSRAVDGVDAAAGSIEGFAQLVARRRHRRRRPTASACTIGANWIDDERLNPFALAAGRAPAAPTEVVLDQATVERRGLGARRHGHRAGQGRPDRR